MQRANRSKKAAATALIALSSLMLLGLASFRAPNTIPAAERGFDLVVALGSLVGLLLRIAAIMALILSIRWRVRLSGYTKTGGRQATAIFLIGFCAFGLVLAISFTDSPPRSIPIIFGLVYAAGLYGCIRWVRNLRRTERTNDSAAPVVQ